MSQHSIAETKDKLSELIGRAEKGEEIVITRHGKPVAKMSAVGIPVAPKRMTKADLDWLMKNRVGEKTPKEDAAALVSRMRDEDWDR
jgi:antitoxin (DNA-binding transcriptional repressor) of toxin-antitoxin stability system